MKKLLKKWKKKKEKELASIKAKVEEKLRKESKASVKKAISEANKSLNKEATKMKDVSDLNEDSETESEYFTDDETLPDNSSEKLVIGEPISNKKDKSSDLDLGIKILDEDPDKFDLDVLDLDTEKLDDNIQLDIEELKL